MITYHTTIKPTDIRHYAELCIDQRLYLNGGTEDRYRRGFMHGWYSAAMNDTNATGNVKSLAIATIDDNKPIGAAMFLKEPLWGHCTVSVYIGHGHRKRGIGTNLVRNLHTLVPSHTIEGVEHDRAASAFYQNIYRLVRDKTAVRAG